MLETDQGNKGFRPRAHEVSRIEAFSDVVFGFALTILVVSLEVPRSVEEFLHELRGFLPFAVCFFLFMQIWHKHYVFFRRYGLQDTTTLILNSLLLFVVLFYVYPLKFLFSLVFGSLGPQRFSIEQSRQVYEVYALGFVAVSFLTAGMYLHAYRQRADLELNTIERLDTLESVYDNFWVGMIGVGSLLIALFAPSRLLGLAGWSYFLIGVPKTIVPTIMARRRRAAAAAEPGQ